MKLYNQINPKAFLLVCMLFICSSCSDFLTKDHPTGVTDEDFWKTMNECENALGQCKLWVKGAYGGEELGLVFLEGATDNMYFQSNFEQRIVSMGKRFTRSPHRQQQAIQLGSDFGQLEKLLRSHPQM